MYGHPPKCDDGRSGYVTRAHRLGLAARSAGGEDLLQVHNFHLVDERTAWLLGSMRVFGLGGGYSFSSFFNIGDGTELVGGLEMAGRTWATSWQAGQLLELAQRFSSNARTETIVFATSVSTVVDPAMLLFAVAIKVRCQCCSDRD